MAYPINAGAILQITFEGSLYGQQVMTVFNYQYNGETSGDGPTLINAAETFVNAAATGLYAVYRDCLSEDVVALSQHYQWITPIRYAYSTVIPDNREGVLPGPAGTANIAAVVTRRSELAGRDQISNLHIPGVPQSLVSNGFLEAGLTDFLEVFGSKSVEPIIVGGFPILFPVTFKRTDPENPAFLTDYYVQVTARDMSRRTVGRGA